MASLAELEARVAELEARKLDVKDLPVQQLIRRLEGRMQPAADQFLLPKSVGPDSLADGVLPIVVTTLPTSPRDGQEVYYVADAVNGVVWHLRYRVSSSSTYKWEFVGGSSLTVFAVSQQAQTNQITYTALPTDPLSLTLPALGGDYDIRVEADIWLDTSGFTNAWLSYDVGATAASDNWACQASVAIMQGSVGRTYRHVAVAASAVIAEKARQGGNYTGRYSLRRITVTPVRLG